MLQFVTALLYLYIFIFGACVGSFLNVLVYRIPAGIPFYKGRSFCPACHGPIRWYDMVPVANWFYLGGKCRACKASISLRYPAVEAAGGVLAVWAFAHYGWSMGPAAAAFSMGALLLTIALIDHDTMEIPNGLVLALCAPALAFVWLQPQVGLAMRLAGAVCVSLPMLLLSLAIPGAFGGGDVKLMAVCGFALGLKACLAGAFVALLLGGGQALWLLATGRAKRGQKAHMAFGPALCAGVWLGLLYGDAAAAWYLGLCGL